MRDKKELLQLAKDILSCQVFTSADIRDEDISLIKIIFLPLSFMDSDFAKKIENKEVYLFYEYVSQANGRCINGYPTFVTMNCLSYDDFLILYDIIEKLKIEYGRIDESLL